VTKVEELTAYSPLALALRLGLNRAAADAFTVALVLLMSVASVRAARKGQDSTVLLGAIIVSLLATPIVWRHYFALLLVPLAISRPRLSAAWAIPVLLLVVPVTDPAMWQLGLTLTAIGALVYILVTRPSADVSWTDAQPQTNGRRHSTLWRSGPPAQAELSS
jgi:hypothetical protein